MNDPEMDENELKYWMPERLRAFEEMAARLRRAIENGYVAGECPDCGVDDTYYIIDLPSIDALSEMLGELL